MKYSMGHGQVCSRVGLDLQLLDDDTPLTMEAFTGVSSAPTHPATTGMLQTNFLARPA
jgi:hypothetical protein